MISEVSLHSSIDGGQMNYWRTACFIGNILKHQKHPDAL